MSAADHSVGCPWLVQTRPAGPSAEAAAATFGAEPQHAILESSCYTEPYGRYSLYAASPAAVVSVSLADGRAGLERLLASLATDSAAAPCPGVPAWAGGWFGYLTYDAGVLLEGLPTRSAGDEREPLARFALYDSFALCDHWDNTWRLVAAGGGPLRAAIDAGSGVPGFTQFTDPGRPAKERLDAVARRLARAEREPRPSPPPLGVTAITPALDAQAYRRGFEAALAYIERGHTYQVNLTQRFATRTEATPLDLYLRLRRLSPASHAALIGWDDRAIVSSSPELFLHVENRRVTTRPIKGTRPRGRTPAADRQLRRELVESEKDTAELAMIVDLLRNDLGKVCRFGSVRVVDPAAIESWPTVFHRTATIEGALADGATRADLLRATLPGGSITGCPKRRAMQIIEELEPVSRGIYCGAIGAIGLAGGLQLNVAIRTMVCRGREVFVHAGGAITSDSTPEAEYAELLTKAQAMLQALGATGADEAKPCTVAQAHA